MTEEQVRALLRTQMQAYVTTLAAAAERLEIGIQAISRAAIGEGFDMQAYYAVFDEEQRRANEIMEAETERRAVRHMN